MDRTALAALALMIVVWGYSWIIMKEMMRYAGPFDFAALRYLGGALFLMLVMLLRGDSLKPPPLALTAVIGLCQTTAFQALAQWALVSGGAAHTSMLAYTMPFWAILLAWWLLHERPRTDQWIGLLLAAAGLLCIMQPWHGLGSLASALMAVAGGIFWALSTVLTKRMFQRHRPSPLAFTAWQMLLGALALCPIALLVPSSPIAWTTPFILGLAYSIIPASGLAWFLWIFIVDRLPTAVASLSSLGVPVTAVLMAWALLHEQLDGFDVAGIVLIVAGLGFLGVGLPPPLPEWGAMVADGRNIVFEAWWVSTLPGIMILVLSLGFNFIGDALRDIIDPGVK